MRQLCTCVAPTCRCRLRKSRCLPGSSGSPSPADWRLPRASSAGRDWQASRYSPCLRAFRTAFPCRRSIVCAGPPQANPAFRAGRPSSLTHSRGFAACAVAAPGSSIGIDLEPVGRAERPCRRAGRRRRGAQSHRSRYDVADWPLDGQGGRSQSRGRKPRRDPWRRRPESRSAVRRCQLRLVPFAAGHGPDRHRCGAGSSTSPPVRLAGFVRGVRLSCIAAETIRMKARCVRRRHSFASAHCAGGKAVSGDRPQSEPREFPLGAHRFRPRRHGPSARQPSLKARVRLY